ncbi:uncharacterized protein LOC131231931 [Magnolia sinica]|uniref:uncharacterized protein LOC131231931 n=1 Tax=Magnolia sinica TaxID=86752 RepID=UPI00265A779F|nr:uncharacterized protein LOC131231931 [Magnolia sinica]
MNKLSGIAKILFWIIIFSALILSTVADGVGPHQRPNAAERAIGLKSPTNPWTKIRSWLNLALMNIWPPDSAMVGKVPSSAEDAMKEAVSKSFKTSERAFETTARVAEKVLRKTAKKVKSSGSHANSGRRNSDEEL